tara:strand:+ start:3175 stop:3489 length:315 start_codon:yes stop_codon:yes gene_type:complete
MKQILIFLLISTSTSFSQFGNPVSDIVGNLTKSSKKTTVEGITIVSNSAAAEGGLNLHTYVFFDSENKKVYTLAISGEGKDKDQIWTFQDLHKLEEESKSKKKK